MSFKCARFWFFIGLTSYRIVECKLVDFIVDKNTGLLRIYENKKGYFTFFVKKIIVFFVTFNPIKVEIIPNGTEKMMSEQLKFFEIVLRMSTIVRKIDDKTGNFRN